MEAQNPDRHVSVGVFLWQTQAIKWQQQRSVLATTLAAIFCCLTVKHTVSPTPSRRCSVRSPGAAAARSAAIALRGSAHGLDSSEAIRCAESTSSAATWCLPRWSITSCLTRETKTCFGITATGSRCARDATTSRRQPGMVVLVGQAGGRGHRIAGAPKT